MLRWPKEDSAISRLLLASVLLAPLLALGSSANAGDVTDPQLETQVIVSGLTDPTSFAFYGYDDFLVLEKATGRVRNVVNGVLVPTPAIDLAVESDAERGLLGIAVHPNFASQPFVYLFYTPSSTGADTVGVAPLANRVVRYQFNGATLTSPTTILTIAQPPSVNFHNGGYMVFGPDGKLYVVVGDRNQNGGLQNGPGPLVADDTSVIFRLNDDGSPASGNPFSGAGFNKYFAYGIRNSFGLAFDPLTGALWETENGVTEYDELNRVAPGFNSGWNLLMGPDARDPDSAANLVQIPGGQYSDPEFSWRSVISPTGLAFLSGSALGAAYNNSLVVGDYIHGEITRFELNPARTAIVPPNAGLTDLVADPGDDISGMLFGSGFGLITDLKVGPDGRLYGVGILTGTVFVIRRVGDANRIPVLSHTALAVLAGTLGTALALGLRRARR